MKTTESEMYTISRDTNLATLISQIGQWFRAVVYNMLDAIIQSMKDEDERDVTIEVKVVNKMLSKLHRFYRGAVVEYYWRQSRDIWNPEVHMDKETRDAMHDEIRTEIRFVRYDHEGKQDGLNSFDTFKSTKAFSDTLKTIESVIFDDQGYMFPKSDEYLADLPLYGHDGANKRAVAKLMDWNANMYKGGRIGDN